MSEFLLAQLVVTRRDNLVVASGFRDLISKPFDVETVLAQIRALLD
jgi:hypothetical protein